MKQQPGKITIGSNWKYNQWSSTVVSFFLAKNSLPEWKQQSFDPSKSDKPTISSAAAYEWTMSKKTSNPSPAKNKWSSRGKIHYDMSMQLETT